MDVFWFKVGIGEASSHQALVVTLKGIYSNGGAGGAVAGKMCCLRVIELCSAAPPQAQRPPLESLSLPWTSCRGRR